jgi:TolB-like protein/DNA-binding winged helix-turn-helix (wHTH) protein/Tfp pilus assembly protein PilF
MRTEQPTSEPRVCFGAFEVDLRAGALSKNGRRIKLQGLPFQALKVLLERPGELVTREELRQRLWPSDTFVDFDASLNTALKKLRQALEESVDKPSLIRTIPHHGYVFIAPVFADLGETEFVENATVPVVASPEASVEGGGRRAFRIPAIVWAGVAAVGLLILTSLLIYLARKNQPPAQARDGGPIRLLVLPFENLSGDPAQEYFSDGLTDEMITHLGGVYPRRLTVIARTSAMQYKGTRKSLEQIARDLGGVDYVLEGSVRRWEGHVRIDAQLFQARDQASLWTQTYERDPRDVLAVQRDVASRVGRSLMLELLPASAAGPDSETNAEAYDEYLKGLYQLNKRTERDVQESTEHFAQSIQKNPRDPRVYAALASAYAIAADWTFLSPNDAYPKAREAAKKALALDDSLAEAHTMLAEVLHEYDWKWTGAEMEYLRALELDPNSAVTHELYAEYLTHASRYDEALAEIRRAQELDPLSLINNAMVGFVYVAAHQYDRAIEELNKTLELDANFAPAHHFLGWAYEGQGRYDLAISEYRKEKGLNQDANYVVAALGISLAKAGRKQEAQAILEELAERSKRSYVSPFGLAQIYLALGDKDGSLTYLNRALEERSFGLVLMASSTQHNVLSNDPRYQQILKMVGSPRQDMASPSLSSP